MQSIKDEIIFFSTNDLNNLKLKEAIKKNRDGLCKNIILKVKNRINGDPKKLHNINQEKGVSNRLQQYPVSGQGHNLNEQQSWDCICLK